MLREEGAADKVTNFLGVEGQLVWSSSRSHP